MKKFLIILVALFVLPLTRCIFPTEFYDIVDIDFKSSKSVYENTADEVLQFRIDYHLKFQKSAHIPRIVKECNATTFPSEMGNRLLWDTFSLSFDKPFEYKGLIYPAGANIFLYPEMRDEITISEKAVDDGYTTIYDFYTQLDFSRKFMNYSEFEGEYMVHFSCETSDGRSFQKSTNILFRKTPNTL